VTEDDGAGRKPLAFALTQAVRRRLQLLLPLGPSLRAAAHCRLDIAESATSVGSGGGGRKKDRLRLRHS